MSAGGIIHVVGAGVAGLSAATILAAKGVRLRLYDAAPQAGGRCRSYFDPAIDGVIDNGNHFVLTGNRAVFAYLDRIGSAAVMRGSPSPVAYFFAIATGEHWAIRPNPGRFPAWLFDIARRVPGTRTADYLELGKLLFARPDQRIGDVLSCTGPLWDKLLRPFFLGALNTQPEEASAVLAGQLVRKTFLRGGNAYRIRIAHPTLAAAFVDPALNFLREKGADISLGERLRAITFSARGPMALEFSEATVPLNPQDAVVLAAPPWVAKDLVPDLEAPDEFRAIVNAHFKMPAPAHAPRMLGVIGGIAEWIFSFHDRISVTVSSADAIVDKDREELARLLWADVCKALDIAVAMPAWQIVKEKRATFAATPAQDKKRPPAATRWPTLFLAGDWTQTGLPGTIEGAIQSGETAARLALRHLGL